MHRPPKVAEKNPDFGLTGTKITPGSTKNVRMPQTASNWLKMISKKEITIEVERKPDMTRTLTEMGPVM